MRVYLKVCMCATDMLGGHRSQRRASDPLNGNYGCLGATMWALLTEPKSSAKASVLDHWAIPLTLHTAPSLPVSPLLDASGFYNLTVVNRAAITWMSRYLWYIDQESFGWIQGVVQLWPRHIKVKVLRSLWIPAGSVLWLAGMEGAA